MYKKNHIAVTDSAAVVDSSKCLIAMILLSAIGNSVLVVQPLMVGAMVDLMGFTDRQAGFVAFAELGSFSLGSLLMSGLVHRFSRHHIAYTGIAIIMLGNILSSFPHDFLPFILARAVSGFGCALPIASFIGTAVLTKVPDKTFGMVNATSIAYSAVLLIISPAIIEYGGLKIIYIGMAVAAFLYGLAVHWIPARPWALFKSTERPGEVDTTRKPTIYGGRLLAMMWISVLLVMFFLYTGHGAIWAYQERIGFSLGIGKQDIGTALGIAMMIGILGSLLAWRLGLAIGRVWPQVISLGLSVVAAVFLISGNSFETFVVASSLITFTWFYGLPYQMGLLARLDPQGRANVTGIVMTTGGSALGPAVAAMIIMPGHYEVIGWFAAACYTLCLGLVIWPAIMINKLDKLRSC